MNRNILIGLIVVVLIVGGVFLVKNSSKNNQQATNVTVNNTQTEKMTASPTAMEESKTSPTGAMMEKKTEHQVTLTESGFEPKNITIKVGDKVVWTNKSGDSATVDSDNHPTHLLYPPLNLGAFQDGEKHELVFDKAGKYTYHDHFHPSRQGTVVVE